MNYQKILFGVAFLFAWLFSASFGFAQDSTVVLPYKCLYSSSYISPRLGIGFQDGFSSEVGIAFQKRNFSCTGFYARTYYTSLEFVPAFKNTERTKNLYALKTGIEINPMGLALGIETKYQTNFSKNDFLITPKIGIGVFGDLLLFYGYNFSLFNEPFTNSSRHQFSLILNINRNFLTLH
jgi:hypothetical protein